MTDLAVGLRLGGLGRHLYCVPTSKKDKIPPPKEEEEGSQAGEVVFELVEAVGKGRLELSNAHAHSDRR